MYLEEKDSVRWGNARSVKCTFGISYFVLQDLVKQKAVKDKKFGGFKTCGRVYNFGDIENYLRSGE